jgi:aspartate/glutamate racemase
MSRPPPPVPRIALVHAVTVAIVPVAAAFAEQWPEAKTFNVLDDSLSPDRAADAQLTAAMSSRIDALAHYAASTGADGILFTCSAFGPAIEAAARSLPVPVLKPNEAMFEQALAQGRRVGMLATFAPSVESMEAEFRELATLRGADATITTVFVHDPMASLKAGDADRHNALLAAAAPRLAECDVLLLAHFSTSRARDAVTAASAAPVLTSPHAAVDLLRKRIEGTKG